MISMPHFTRLTLAAVLACAPGACVHTPPGTSVEVALAKKAELVRLAQTQHPTGAGKTAGSGVVLPAVEPPLPENDKAEQAADAFGRGNFCMNVGKDAEAIEAFEEAVKIVPAFTDAWQQLAALYEKTGESQKAIEAARRAKKVARQ